MSGSDDQSTKRDFESDGSSTDIDDNRKRVLAQALFESKPGEIGRCDDCDTHVLHEHLHTYYGSMGKEWPVCPDCDLPEKWHSKYSKRRRMRYYVYFDPHTGWASRVVKWGHPTEGNPLHIADDRGESLNSSKQKTCRSSRTHLPGI